MAQISIELGKKLGKIKPVWGVNGGPETKVFTYDAKPLFREAGFPLCRLHDVEYPYGSGEFVDIPCIFRDFDADETDPANYNFALTDLYIEKIREVGASVFFRLGVSIEHAPVKRYIYPPKDPAKWARICEHIIRHYNEGFANGHHWGITYWEIWNEPDGGDNMWLGSPEEFYELYAVTACHLKACFPELKIGGCGFTKAKSSFMEGFFSYLKADPRRIPLDFYSWHIYHADLPKLQRYIAEAEELKAEYGYAEAESILNEWNYMEDWRHQGPSYRILCSAKGAAFCAADLITMQNSPVAAACYYEADVVKEWCGLFEVEDMCIGRHGKATLRPRKPFYAFSTFGRLAKRGTQVAATCDCTDTYVLAAADNAGMDALITVYGGTPGAGELRINGAPEGARVQVYIVDEERSLAPLAEGTAVDGSVCLPLPLAENDVYAIRMAF